MASTDSGLHGERGGSQLPGNGAADDDLALDRRQLVRAAQLAAIERLAASLAHDLRNPLAVVRNTVYVIKRKLAKGETTQALEYLDLIDRELSTTDRMIRELVAMTRGEAPRRQPVELDELLAAARDRLPAGLRIQWTREGPGLTLHLDRDQFVQVFGNLFLNAAQAMGGEGGTISVRSRAGDEADEIRVIDTGPGIAPELAEQVFEPLFTSRKSGAGLGLTICRQIVERHGGTISVEPNAPGAVLCIRLPRAPFE